MNESEILNQFVKCKKVPIRKLIKHSSIAIFQDLVRRLDEKKVELEYAAYESITEIYKSNQEAFSAEKLSDSENFFAPGPIREAFCLYVEELFQNPDPRELSELFSVKCCKKRLHSDECIQKWKTLKEYLTGEMLRLCTKSQTEITINSFDDPEIMAQFRPVQIPRKIQLKHN